MNPIAKSLFASTTPSYIQQCGGMKIDRRTNASKDLIERMKQMEGWRKIPSYDWSYDVSKEMLANRIYDLKLLLEPCLN